MYSADLVMEPKPPTLCTQTQHQYFQISIKTVSRSANGSVIIRLYSDSSLDISGYGYSDSSLDISGYGYSDTDIFKYEYG
jgi:hypothetical protein